MHLNKNFKSLHKFPFLLIMLLFICKEGSGTIEPVPHEVTNKFPKLLVVLKFCVALKLFWYKVLSVFLGAKWSITSHELLRAFLVTAFLYRDFAIFLINAFDESFLSLSKNKSLFRYLTNLYLELIKSSNCILDLSFLEFIKSLIAWSCLSLIVTSFSILSILIF